MWRWKLDQGEFKEILGDYFAAYMGSTQLCNYNIGIDSMAAEWKDSLLAASDPTLEAVGGYLELKQP